MPAVPETAAVIAPPEPAPPALSPAEAMRRRMQLHGAALWLDRVWCDAAAVPAFDWNDLLALPTWARRSPYELKRLAMLTGALAAAPRLRVCLDAQPLRRMRRLVGAEAFELALAAADLPTKGLHFPIADEAGGHALYAWSASLLLASLPTRGLRASMGRVLGLSAEAAAAEPLIEPVQAQQLVMRAHDIVQALEIAPAVDAPQPAQVRA